MKIDKVIQYGANQFHATMEQINICPVCKYSICVDEVVAYPFRDNARTLNIAELYICPKCSQPFIAQYRCRRSENGILLPKHDTDLEYVAPSPHQKRVFDPEIKALSPSFVDIFNESAAAEAQGLKNIVGGGYRKSIEFLVKDYCIHKHPEDSDRIKEADLSHCIRTWIDSERIKTLASRAVWIGNDETHYVRKQPDLDIEDMKRFIRALLGFISSELAYEEASEISSAK